MAIIGPYRAIYGYIQGHVAISGHVQAGLVGRAQDPTLPVHPLYRHED